MLFNGQDFTGWTLPAGDNGHWKIVDGVIDYDARSEAKGDKSLWSERECGDAILHVDWRIKQTPYVNPNIPTCPTSCRRHTGQGNHHGFARCGFGHCPARP